VSNHHHVHKQRAEHPDIHASFIREAIPSAQASEKITGVPASVTIAQAILESGRGKPHITAAHNYFGVKAHAVSGKVTYGSVATGYVNVKTKEHVKGKDITISDNFRSYKSMQDSFIDHGNFLRDNHSYHSILAAYAKDGDSEAFARGLQTAGYATDPHYAKLLIKIIKGRKLDKHNLKQPAESSTSNVIQRRMP
jgi:flagellum-specific peptidoglycan hydrolase FlgJ